LPIRSGGLYRFSMKLKFLGATRMVTGSCHLLEVGGRQVLLDCGLLQGGREDEARNREPFPFDPRKIDAVVLSHAHLDHSGLIPLLVKRGFAGKIYTQRASRDLCRVLLKDAAFLGERDAEWETRKRRRKGLEPVEPLYTVQDVQAAMRRFKGIDYGREYKLAPGVRLRLRDAGHILGAAIVELWLEEGGTRRHVVFSGDLGHRGAPILRDPEGLEEAPDLLLLESTYGDRNHRSWDETWCEMGEVLQAASADGGNVLIPAFAVGRSQELLYAFAKHFDDWSMGHWAIFLDSPMAIEATRIYARHTELYDREAAAMWTRGGESLLPNLTLSHTSKQSMAINRVRSGALIIAGSGMCTGGRIRHHFKHNIWRRDTHLIIVGFQARGTLGRALVEGAEEISLWGERIRVAARVHTVGGLSAHADQEGLMEWYRALPGRPPVALVHGEEESMGALQRRLHEEAGVEVMMPRRGESLDLSADLRERVQRHARFSGE